MRRMLLMLVVSAILVLALAVPAFAQKGPPENPPPSEQGTKHANSICSYSGLNDNDPKEGGADLGRVQSYGDYVKEGLKSEQPSPGFLCNGHLMPYPESFPEPV